MDNQIIKKITENKIPCVFVSPHLDDSILSAGALMCHLSQKTKVTAITVFTEASPKPYTLSAKKFLYSCGYRNAQELFDARKKEDSNIFSGLGVEFRHLGFTDAAWRKKENPGYLINL